MAHVGVAHDDELAPAPAARGGVAGQLEQREEGVVIDRIRAEPAYRSLRSHDRGDGRVVEQIEW